MNPALVEHCARLPRSVLCDEATGLLMDVASGKTLDVTTLEALEQRLDPRTAAPLVGLRLADGRSFALAEVGIAFAPVFTHTGPLEELPAAVCWADLRTLLGQLKLELYGATGRPSASTVRVLMCCLAIVDGARALGFDVGPEEQELEWHLKELERRAPS